MKKQALSATIGALVAGVTIFAIIFFWKNPFREGELSFETSSGAKMCLKVANSNDITELLRKALQDEEVAQMITYSLLAVIESLPPNCALGEKLCNMVQNRTPPFCPTSIPVKLIFDDKMQIGVAAACDNSYFLSKRIVVYPMTADGGGDPMNTLGLHVDGRLAFSCPDGVEILRVNSEKVQEFNLHQVMAKHDF